MDSDQDNEIKREVRYLKEHKIVQNIEKQLSTRTT